MKNTPNRPRRLSRALLGCALGVSLLAGSAAAAQPDLARDLERAMGDREINLASNYTAKARMLDTVTPGLSDRTGYTVGSRLCEYALIWGMADEQPIVDTTKQRLDEIAGAADLRVEDLPPRRRTGEFDPESVARALKYVLDPENPTIADLSKQLGERPVQWAKLGVMFRVTRLLYFPGDDMSQTFADAFDRFGRELELPEGFFDGLVEGIRGGASRDRVAELLTRAEKAVDRYHKERGES